MATQVKFYSTATLPSNADNGGIYFVGGPKNGELYKGTTRFGAARVKQVANTTERDAIEGAIRGDIAVCAQGGAFVYDGTNWVAIGPDLAAVKASWLADIKTSISGLDVDFVGSTNTASIITGIKEVDGKIVANASAFPQLTSPSDGHVSLNGTDVEISGWSALVSDKNDLKSRVTGLETWKGSITGDAIAAGTKVTAETGTFKNLTISDTATFSATTVKATTLTVDNEEKATFGGATISAIADREALAKIAAIPATTKSAIGASVVTVYVTTSAGSVNKVYVGVQKATSIAASGFASDNMLATEKAVREALNSLDNAMHFTGVVTYLPESGKAGDIVVIGANPTGANPTGANLVAGQEYIYDGKKWELIGDQNTYAMNAYSKDGSAVMTGVTTVPGALDKLAGAVDKLDGDANVDGSVKKQIKDAVEALDATVNSARADMPVQVVETDGKLTSVSADLLWCGANGEPL